MKKILTIVALGMTAQVAHASLVEFVMEGEVGMISGGTLSDVSIGTTARSSFILDTGAIGATSIDYMLRGTPPESVVSRFLVNDAKFLDISTTLGGNGFFAAVGSGTYDGLLSNSSSFDYDLSMFIQASTFSLIMRDFNTINAAGITAREIGGDPATVLAFSFDLAPAFTYFRSDFGLYGLSMRSLLVREVPEPSTVSLFAVALVLFGFAAIRGRSTQKCGKRRR